MTKIVIRQITFDLKANDDNQWCLFINGRMKYAGMTKQEAERQRDKAIAALAKVETGE